MPPLKKPNDVLFDREDLQGLIESELDDRMRTRLKAILGLMQGVRQVDVAETLQISTASIREWVRRWNSGAYYALLPDRKGSWTTRVARESLRKDGFDLVRQGRFLVMQPLAILAGTDKSGEPLKLLYFPDWDRPSKASLARLID